MSKKIPQSIKKIANSRDFQPSVRIGKSGITENLIEEIDAQLSKKDIVKIKINRGLFERSKIDDIWRHLSEETDSSIVSARGNVCVLWR
ncbi:MAG: YhbY family RNA-binding protein [Candidatus Poseidoniaceae archaeon]|tara:strand:- start:2316 stop:2582 length:267 start_codon:yes stop_codon:yes gene_type:complete